MLLDALEYGKGDWNKSFRYLEDKFKPDSGADVDTYYAAKNAHSYLKGIYGQYYFKKKKEK